MQEVTETVSTKKKRKRTPQTLLISNVTGVMLDLYHGLAIYGHDVEYIAKQLVLFYMGWLKAAPRTEIDFSEFIFNADTDLLELLRKCNILRCRVSLNTACIRNEQDPNALIKVKDEVRKKDSEAFLPITVKEYYSIDPFNGEPLPSSLTFDAFKNFFRSVIIRNNIPNLKVMIAKGQSNDDICSENDNYTELVQHLMIHIDYLIPKYTRRAGTHFHEFYFQWVVPEINRKKMEFLRSKYETYVGNTGITDMIDEMSSEDLDDVWSQMEKEVEGYEEELHPVMIPVEDATGEITYEIEYHRKEEITHD